MTTENRRANGSTSRKTKKYLGYPNRHNPNFLPPPLFIEITGTPSSGKTTTIVELDKLFRRKGLRVLCLQEGAQAIRHVGRETPLYNLRTAIYALNLLIDLSHGHDYDVVIFDRSLFDSFCWMMYWEEKGKLTNEEKKLYQEFFKFRLWISKIDVALFMLCEPEEAMRRELRIALTQEYGETSNPKTITTLVNRYRAGFKELSPNHPQLRLLDTTDLNEQTMVQTAANKIFSMLEKRIDPTSENENPDFEKIFQKIHSYLKTDIRYDQKVLPRPFFIEISGTPSSGKTTIITELDKCFRRLGFKVLCPQEGAQVIRHMPRHSPVYSARTALYATSLLIDFSQGHKYDIVIFDRCIFDPYCWLELYEENKDQTYKKDEGLVRITTEEKGILRSFFLSRFWKDNIDLAIFAICEPQTAVERELKTAIIKKLGTATNHDTLNKFVEIHYNAFRSLNSQYPQLAILDTTILTKETMVKIVAEWALAAFETKAKTQSLA